jgi:hypothetical protein
MVTCHRAGEVAAALLFIYARVWVVPSVANQRMPTSPALLLRKVPIATFHGTWSAAIFDLTRGAKRGRNIQSMGSFGVVFVFSPPLNASGHDRMTIDIRRIV